MWFVSHATIPAVFIREWIINSLQKILVREAGIAAPDLIGVVKTQGHVRELKEFLAHEKAFVIKPAKGSGGKGILVITGRDGEDYLKPSGERVTHHDVCKHASNTLSGLFSLGGNNDVAMIEELVDFDPIFDGFSFKEYRISVLFSTKAIR